MVTFQFRVGAAATKAGLNIREVTVEGSGTTPKVIAKTQGDFCASATVSALLDGDTNTKFVCTGTQAANTVLFEIEAGSDTTAFKVVYDSPDYEPVMQVYRDGGAVIYPLGVAASTKTSPAPYTATYTLPALGDPSGGYVGVWKHYYEDKNELESTTTFVTCDGRIWGGFNTGAVQSGGLSGWTKSAGTGGKAPNNDPNYPASDGWYFRDMEANKVGKRWQFYRFKDGTWEIHYFDNEKSKDKTSPLGSDFYRTQFKTGTGASRIEMLTDFPQTCGSFEGPGQCVTCAQGSAGSLSWIALSESWDTSSCQDCAIANCLNCKGNKDECIECASGYTVKDALKKECIAMETCDYGHVGTVTYDISKGQFDKSGCKASDATCEDTTQTKGSCTDCKDGYAGSVDWDYTNQVWITSQCEAVACPLSSETSPSCTKCPEFQTGAPIWDDLFNEWVGCIANDFGFSGPSASWASGIEASASVSASYATVTASFATADFATVAAELNVASLSEPYKIETISAEMLHVANNQYDAISEKWVCDEGFAGVGCKQRLCPETVAFTSGTDGFTPSQSVGFFFTTDAGLGTSATFNNQHSYRECGGRGTCDFETGLCQCFPGFTGVGCRRTTCPNGCSGHGVCMNDDLANYHAAGRTFLPPGDTDINTWGNLWSSNKFQGCKCDGGWSGNDCSLRQCPRGDDPETQCADELGNDVQYITCTNMFVKKNHFFKLRFTDQIGNRYNTRAIVVNGNANFVATMSEDVYKSESLTYSKAAAHSIQTALESLPNFVVPKVEVTTPDDLQISTFQTGPKNNRKTNYEVDKKLPDVVFTIEFTDGRTSGQQMMLEIEEDMKCADGVQPKFANAAGESPTCTVTRKASDPKSLRENAECSNRGLCNRKTAECNCFDGYTGLACDILAQTY